MYFWRIHRLTADLRRGDLSEPVAFRYLLSMLLLLVVCSSPALANRQFPADYRWLAITLNLVLVAGGTALAYRANGGAAGRAFVSRYLALSWVLGIRLFAVLFLPLVLLFALLAPDAQGRGGAPMVADLLCTVVTSSVFYWRLAVHLRAVAAPEPSSVANDSGGKPSFAVPAV